MIKVTLPEVRIRESKSCCGSRSFHAPEFQPDLLKHSSRFSNAQCLRRCNLFFTSIILFHLHYTLVLYRFKFLRGNPVRVCRMLVLTPHKQASFSLGTSLPTLPEPGRHSKVGEAYVIP